MERSGCLTALVGFESLEERNLTQMKKQWNLKHGDYATSIRKLQDHGMMVYGTFVFGYDHDTPGIFDRSVDFALAHAFSWPTSIRSRRLPEPGSTIGCVPREADR